MPMISAGNRITVQLPEGRALALTPAAASTGNLFRNAARVGASSLSAQSFSSATTVGPFPTARTYQIECVTGSVTFDIVTLDTNFASLLGNVEPFTGARTLTPDDNGKILRCDDSSNVTVTVPNSLPEGFNVGLAMWGTGTVTIAAGSGSTNRSTKTALSTRYQIGGVLVVKNTGGSAAEYTLGGDFA